MQHVWKPETAPWDMYTCTICQSSPVQDPLDIEWPEEWKWCSCGRCSFSEEFGKKLRVCGMQMQLWRMKINEKDEVWGKFVGQKPIAKLVGLNLLTCFTSAILCPVNPTRPDSEVLRLRTESLERLNLQIESERRDVGMPRRVPGFSLKMNWGELIETRCISVIMTD